jgi:outer membrane murein-binding lipoprotein Lpp
MKQTLVLAFSIVFAAVLVAVAVISLNAHVNALADDVATLTREITAIGEDVRSLADDVAALTDTMTEEDGDAGDDQQCPSDI